MAIKRLQNIISESRLTLPFVSIYGVAVWIAAGLLQEQWWPQFVCFVASVYLMMELNTSNALIRIYSRMVSCSFIVLTSAACFLFGSFNEAAAILCVIVSYNILFHAYQDHLAMGRMFYGFLFIGLASMLYAETLYYVPALWLLVLSCIQAFGWRNFFSSVLGLITPYWFAAVWFVYKEDFTLPMEHFSRLADIHFPVDYSQLTTGQVATFVFIMATGLTGTVHYLRTSYNDKIRIRMLYNFFIAMNMLSAVFIIVQPQHYDFLLRMITVNTSPLIAHFISLTRTRVTNIAFYVMTAAALILTGYNLWMSSLNF